MSSLETSSGGGEAGPANAAHTEGDLTRAGRPLEAGTAAASWEAVADALRTVYDPEIPVNIFELGLIYRLDVASDGKVGIDMTLTAPACPVAGTLPGQVADTVAGVPGVGEVEVKLVWDPPWTPQRMSEDARMVLDIP
jgi:FeS assembly SUF system protein